MSYVKVTNGKAEIYSIGQLRRDNPNTSFPRNIPDKMLKTYKVYKLHIDPEPIIDRDLEQTSLKDPELVNNKWVQKWEVEKLPLITASQNMRAKRDKLLTETVDKLNPIRWEDLDDLEKRDWQSYRRQLLEVPEQEGFPYDIAWPIAPSQIKYH